MADEEINPYAAPQADSTRGGFSGGKGKYEARREGELLIVDKQTSWAPVCVKCGSKKDLTQRMQDFQWIPPWVPLLFLVCNLAALIAFFVMRKTAKLELPLCVPCDERWGQAKTMTIVAVVLLLGAIFVPLFIGEPQAIIFGFLVGFGGFLGILLGYVKPRMLQVKKIDEHEVHLAGVHPNAIEAMVG